MEKCLNIRMRYDESLTGGWAPRLTLLLSGFLCSPLINDYKASDQTAGRSEHQDSDLTNKAMSLKSASRTVVLEADEL